MSDKQAPINGTQRRTGGAPRALGRWLGFLMHRWPTLLGIAVAALTALDTGVTLEFVSSVAALIVVMPLVYVGTAALDRPRAAWVVLLAALPAALFVSPTWGIVVLAVAAALFLALGVARGQLRRPGGLTLQAAGMLAFGAIAVAALYVDPAIGIYVVALALLAHGAWDAVHFLRDRVVARSYAEFCGVLDLVLGVTILALVLA